MRAKKGKGKIFLMKVTMNIYGQHFQMITKRVTPVQTILLSITQLTTVNTSQQGLLKADQPMIQISLR